MESNAGVPGDTDGTPPFPTSRRHRLKPPKGPAGKALLGLKDGFESLVARASVHGDPPVYDTSLFPWVAEIESEWRTVRAELDRVMTRLDDLANFQDISSQVESITRDDQWKTFFLAALGDEIDSACEACPETARLLRQIPGRQTAFFSILSPRKHIPAHRGAYNGLLRFHLGLKVPNQADKCRIRVADRFLSWREGSGIVFDDTFNHEVWNDTDEHRAVLFVDFLRPLRPPMSLVNRGLMRAAVLTPVLKEARRNQREWERRFHGAQRHETAG